MSDGGKGSAPRPYSVDQETYNSNWDKIFGKKKSEKLVVKPSCYCYNCNIDESTIPYVASHMIVCPTCGNNIACTNSNEPN